MSRMTFCNCIAQSVSAITLAVGAFMQPAAAQVGPPSLIADLVSANHILFDQGVVDGFGHISVRNPANPERFFLSRARAPAEVEAADIMEFDFDGKPTGGPRDKPVFRELYIHAEVLRAHRNVNAVVHSHSPAVIPFGVVETPFRPVSQTGSFLCGGVPNFELLEKFPDAPNLLVTSGEKGRALAEAIGNRPVALMRGHGNTVVGSSIKEAVFRAVFTEVAARLTSQAIMLAGGGKVKDLSDKECETTVAAGQTSGSSEGLERNWETWAKQAAAKQR